MALKLFYELDSKKRDTIIDAALKEFAQYGYHGSSTNRIVKNAEIGKGSLFKYFTNKEELYFDILDYSIVNLFQVLEGEISNLPKSLFERIIKYAEIEISWYIKNPIQYELLKKAFINDNSDIYRKTLEKYSNKSAAFYYSLFEDIDSKEFKTDKAKILNIIKWVLEGFNEAFINEIKTNEDINSVKERYMKKLEEYIRILKDGV